MSKLIDKIADIDPTGALDDSDIVHILTMPDVNLPRVLQSVSGRTLAEIPTWTGELAWVRLAAKTGIVPASKHPSGVATAITEVQMVNITTLLEAVDKELVLDLSVQVPEGFPTPLSILDGLLDTVETLGLLSAVSRALVMSKTERLQSWAEKENEQVDAGTVGKARGAN